MKNKKSSSDISILCRSGVSRGRKKLIQHNLLAVSSTEFYVLGIYSTWNSLLRSREKEREKKKMPTKLFPQIGKQLPPSPPLPLPAHTHPVRASETTILFITLYWLSLFHSFFICQSLCPPFFLNCQSLFLVSLSTILYCHYIFLLYFYCLCNILLFFIISLSFAFSLLSVSFSPFLYCQSLCLPLLLSFLISSISLNLSSLSLSLHYCQSLCLFFIASLPVSYLLSVFLSHHLYCISLCNPFRIVSLSSHIYSVSLSFPF